MAKQKKTKNAQASDNDKKKTEDPGSEGQIGQDAIQARRKLKKADYEKELEKLQVELVKLQEWIRHKKLKVVAIFEGRDAAGKGGTITRIMERLSPRVCRVVALYTPTERQKTQWYFQRYVEQLRTCPEFERMLVRSGIILLKYWFSVSDEVQEKRFQDRIHDPRKRWKLSPMDLESRAKWADYSRAKDSMFAYTDIKQAPWYVVNADEKRRARLNCIHHLLSMIPYEDLTPEPIELPPRQDASSYIRPPLEDQNFVPEVYPPKRAPAGTRAPDGIRQSE